MKTPNAANVAALILCGLCSFGCSHSNQSPGRFQIFSGTIDSDFDDPPNIADHKPEHLVLKIDTVTGQTWEFEDYTYITDTNATTHYGWQEVKGIFTNQPINAFDKFTK